MDLNIILGWSVTILTIAGLVFYIRLRNRNRHKKALVPLLSFARDNNSEISFFDSWDKTLIGIDNKEINSLFFIRNIPGNVIREKINLSEVSDCRMFKTERKAKYHKETVNVIDRIELIFSFYNHKPELSLEFYNTDYDQLTLSGELQLAQKWTGTIISIVNTNREWMMEKEKAFTKPGIVRPHESLGAIINNRGNKKPVQKKYAI